MKHCFNLLATLLTTLVATTSFASEQSKVKVYLDSIVIRNDYAYDSYRSRCIQEYNSIESYLRDASKELGFQVPADIEVKFDVILISENEHSENNRYSSPYFDQNTREKTAYCDITIASKNPSFKVQQTKLLKRKNLNKDLQKSLCYADIATALTERNIIHSNVKTGREKLGLGSRYCQASVVEIVKP